MHSASCGLSPGTSGPHCALHVLRGWWQIHSESHLPASHRREGRAGRGGTQVQLQVFSSRNNQMQRGRKNTSGGWVTQWRWAGLVTWMAADRLRASGRERCPPPPAVDSRAVPGSGRWSPSESSPSCRPAVAAPPGPAWLWPIRAGQPRSQPTPPPPCTPARFGISPLNPQAATCSFRVRAAPTLLGNFDIVGGCHGEEGDVIDTKNPLNLQISWGWSYL